MASSRGHTPGAAALIAATIVLALARPALVAAQPGGASPAEVFDYIIVGAGPGGSGPAVALAKEGYRVLLIDAGKDYPDSNLNYSAPIFNPQSTEDELTALNYRVKYSEDRTSVLYPRAASLGGCLSHHALITSPTFTTRDFETVSKATGEGSWNTDDMQRLWMNIEDSYQFPPEVANPCDHGFRGWLPTLQRNILPPEVDARVLIPYESMTRAQWPRLNKYNDSLCAPTRDAEGSFAFSTSTSPQTGTRNTTRNYVKLAMSEYPDKLFLKLDTLVSKVLFEDDVAIGVLALEGSHLFKASPNFDPNARSAPKTYYAMREVIIAGGTFESPKLLQNSGIGPRAVVEGLGVNLIQDLPGVGRNLQDRYEVANTWKTGFNMFDLCVDPDFQGWCLDSWQRYGNFSQWSLNGVLTAIKATTGFTTAAPGIPDMILFGGPSYFQGYETGWSKLENYRVLRDRWSFLVLKAYAQNDAGYVKSVSSDPRDSPEIDFAQFKAGADQDMPALIQGIRWMRELAEITNRLAKDRGLKPVFLAEEIEPGAHLQSDEELEEWIRNTTWGHHACCTNKMGGDDDDMAVLDGRLRVRGVKNLRVSDASVWPAIPSYFISVPMYILGEHAGNLIKDDANDACKKNPWCDAGPDVNMAAAIAVPVVIAAVIAAIVGYWWSMKKRGEGTGGGSDIVLFSELGDVNSGNSNGHSHKHDDEGTWMDLFKLMDSDKDNTLSFAEFFAALKKSESTQDITEEDARQVFEHLDTDEEKGTLSRAEWIAWNKQRVSRNSTTRPISHKPIDLSFVNLSCAYTNKKTGDVKRVLQKMSGYFPAGSFCALMGPSGAGKSTLLDILAGRKSTGEISGSIMVNGKERDSSFSKVMAYVVQEDLFVPKLTVLEMTKFYCDLRLPPGVSNERKVANCRAVLEMVGLSERADVQVGGPLPGGINVRGLSGGQKRRLSLACALVTNPSILLLDEPTSGLDAFSSLMVMDLMQSLAHERLISVICTIHQPRSIIWSMFDQLCLTAAGRMMYFGPAKDAVRWFVKMGYPYPEGTNPADWIIDLVSTDFEKDPKTFGEKTMRDKDDIEKACVAFEDANKISTDTQIQIYLKTIHDSMADISSSYRTEDASGMLANQKVKGDLAPDGVGWLAQYSILLQRHFRSCVRNPGNVLARFGIMLITGVSCGWVYVDLPDDEVFSRAGVLYFLAFIYIVLPFCQLGLFIYDRQFYSKERAAQLYSTSPYFVAVVSFETVFNTINVVISATIAYFMIGLGNRFESNGMQFGAYLLILAVLHTVGVQWVSLCALAMPNQDLAFAGGAGFLVIMQLCAGFLVIAPELQPSIGWLQWISYLKYGWVALMVNEFKEFDRYSDSAIQVLGGNFIDINGPHEIWVCVVAMLGFWLAYNIIGFLCLKHLHKEQR